MLTFSSPDKSGLLFSSLLNFCFFAGISFPAWEGDSDMFLFSLILAQIRLFRYSAASTAGYGCFIQAQVVVPLHLIKI